MIPDCPTTLAGHCLSWAPVRVIMVTLLWSSAAVLADRAWLEVRADE